MLNRQKRLRVRCSTRVDQSNPEKLRYPCACAYPARTSVVTNDLPSTVVTARSASRCFFCADHDASIELCSNPRCRARDDAAMMRPSWSSKRAICCVPGPSDASCSTRSRIRKTSVQSQDALHKQVNILHAAQSVIGLGLLCPCCEEA